MSIPIPRRYKNIQKDMLDGVQSGRYLLGELIEPKTYKKFMLDKTGEVKEVEYTVCG